MTYIKHMAFAVSSVDDTLQRYQTMLGVGLDARVVTAEKARIKVAIFNVGDIEYQLNESLDADGRFSQWIAERGTEGSASYMLCGRGYRCGAGLGAAARRNA